MSLKNRQLTFKGRRQSVSRLSLKVKAEMKTRPRLNEGGLNLDLCVMDFIPSCWHLLYTPLLLYWEKTTGLESTGLGLCFLIQPLCCVTWGSHLASLATCVLKIKKKTTPSLPTTNMQS